MDHERISASGEGNLHFTPFCSISPLGSYTDRFRDPSERLRRHERGIKKRLIFGTRAGNPRKVLKVTVSQVRSIYDFVLQPEISEQSVYTDQGSRIGRPGSTNPKLAQTYHFVANRQGFQICADRGISFVSCKSEGRKFFADEIFCWRPFGILSSLKRSKLDYPFSFRRADFRSFMENRRLDIVYE